jgi:hypothetical protein
VELPAWFEALTRDFRYQLTPVGQFAQVMVASEIENGRFCHPHRQRQREGLMASYGHPA